MAVAQSALPNKVGGQRPSPFRFIWVLWRRRYTLITAIIAMLLLAFVYLDLTPTRSATARRKVTSAAAAAKTPLKSDEPKVERVTKQERVLSLLSQSEGASIEEMMQVTDWQHSVRGFLAGTVKKEARLFANRIEVQRRRSPLPHRTAARPVTWKNGRSISQRRSCGFRR